MMHSLRTSLAILVTTATLVAQIDDPPVYPGKIGFSIAGSQGSAGILCSGFQCAPLTLGLTRGETLSLSIRTQLQLPWLLLAGPSTLPSCLSLPGIGNTWAGPSILVAAGRVTQNDRIRCWGGLATLQVSVPASSSLKDTAAFQVVADNTGRPVFSAPVQVTVTK